MADVEGLSRNTTQTQNQNESHDQKKVEHPTTYLQTLVNLLKGCLGTGILAMPLAFSKAGWLVGCVGTVLAGLLCTYAIHMLVHSEEELCRRRKVRTLTYHSTWQSAIEDGPRSFRWLAPYAA